MQRIVYKIPICTRSEKVVDPLEAKVRLERLRSCLLALAVYDPAPYICARNLPRSPHG
jgi:hypothetical protein